ncbi:MAG: hypothetical protein HQL82_08415 [Magnetococcales bacterium]|nr:hypothetical protein [Magnetococcales bacterium]
MHWRLVQARERLLRRWRRWIHPGSLAPHAPVPLAIPTYDDSGQATHPDVLRFANPWQGHRYWMVMTPYPFLEERWENPSILVSADGRLWDVPEGLDNPVVDEPREGFHADPDLVYDPRENRLWIYYLHTLRGERQWLKRTGSPDGRHWTAPETLLECAYQTIRSPALVLEDGRWRLWSINMEGGPALDYRESADGRLWSKPTVLPLGLDRRLEPTHLDVVADVAAAGGYWMICQAAPVRGGGHSLYLAHSADGLGWSCGRRPLLSLYDAPRWAGRTLYRATMVMDASRVTVWYAARNRMGESRVGLTRMSREVWRQGVENRMPPSTFHRWKPVSGFHGNSSSIAGDGWMAHGSDTMAEDAEDADDKKARELIRAVNRLFNSAQEADSFTLARYKKEARSLRSTHGAAANLLLARLACLEGNEAQMRVSHQLILGARANHPEVYFDYANSLRKLGFYSEAREQLDIAHQLDPGNTEYLQYLVKTCLISGHIQSAWYHLELAMKAGSQIYRKEYDFLSGAVRFVTENSLTDDELDRLQRAALAVIHDSGLHPVGMLRAPAVHMELFASGTFSHGATGPTVPHPFLRWGLQVPLKGEPLGDLNSRLAQGIAASGLPERVADYVKIRCIPWTMGGFSPTGFYF